MPLGANLDPGGKGRVAGSIAGESHGPLPVVIITIVVVKDSRTERVFDVGDTSTLDGSHLGIDLHPYGYPPRAQKEFFASEGVADGIQSAGDIGPDNGDGASQERLGPFGAGRNSYLEGNPLEAVVSVVP